MSTHFYIANSILEDMTPEALHRKRESAGRTALLQRPREPDNVSIHRTGG